MKQVDVVGNDDGSSIEGEEGEVDGVENVERDVGDVYDEVAGKCFRT